MDDRQFEDELGRLFLKASPGADVSRHVAPVMTRIETEGRGRIAALAGATGAGIALALGAIAASGAYKAVGTVANEAVSAASHAAVILPQPGLWTLAPVVAVIALALTTLGLSRAAQAL